MQVSILDVPVRSIGMPELLESFSEGLLVFHNLDTVGKTRRDPEFRAACRAADLAVIDGQVLRFLVSALWGRAAEKVSGSDFLPAFCTFHAPNQEVSVFLLGAGPGVAARAMHELNRKAGRPIVVGAHSPSFGLLDDDEESSRVVELINASGADTLAVGMGAPRQELWMSRHRQQMPAVRRLIAVGATLDFEAGRVRRAPAWMSAVGLEWAFRLLSEPRRLWRRYLVEGPGVVLAMAAARIRELRAGARKRPESNAEMMRAA